MEQAQLSSTHRPRGPGHITVRDGKAGLPYSKGLMATSVMAAGLPPRRAYDVAEVVEGRLRADGTDAVSTADLRELAAQVIEEEVGPRYAQNYRCWQRAQARSVPLIVFIGGATGVGKSTIATTVANRLGIVRIVSTDAVREVMRGIFTREMMPILYASSFDTPSLLPDLHTEADPVVAGYRQQVRAVSVGVGKIVRRAVLEGTDLIVEGAHAVPGFLDLPAADEAIVASMVVTVDDEHAHRSHFAARAQETRNRGDRRYLDSLHQIRRIQDHIRELAAGHGVSVVSSYSLDATVSRVTELVVAAATDVPQPPPGPRPPPRPPVHAPATTRPGGAGVGSP
ncbi:2-phosphoglycerate kinase [soil metagenome]